MSDRQHARRCREVFFKRYQLILEQAGARKELNEYNGLKGTVSRNKYFLGVPAVALLGCVGHQMKFPADQMLYKKIMAVTLGIAALHSAYAFSCSTKISPLEERLIDTYVLPLDNVALDKFDKNHRFPMSK